MANISAIKLPNGTTYTLKDNGALQLTGGQVTGPVTFGDSISVDEATIGDLVVNGGASFTNDLQANTINGVTVGSNPKFTDTITTVSTTGNGNAVTAISASNGALTVTKGTTFLTSYTETDPVFSASAAAGITSTDINNWNAKVSDDKTWNGVTLDKTGTTQTSTSYIPARSNTSATTAYQLVATTEPYQYRVAKWDSNAYLYSTTPSTNDNSTKVATTAYVNSKHNATTVTLSTTWTSNQQTVTVSGVTTSNTVIVSPAPASYDAYCEAGIYCSAQAANSLTFKCDTAPSASLIVNVMIVN